VRVFVKAASGRQRFNVLGAWNAVTRELLTVTSTTVVNTDTMCDLLRLVAARGLVGPVTLDLDNARYQRNALVMGLAKDLGIELLFLPSYSPNLNLIERLWRFVKRKAVYDRYHPDHRQHRNVPNTKWAASTKNTCRRPATASSSRGRNWVSRYCFCSRM
jgi:transposase